MAEGGSSGLKLDGTISLGHLMAAIPAITIAFSILWWVVGYTSRIEANSKRLEELQTELRASIKDLHDQLAAMPDLKAHIAAVERELEDQRAVNAQQQNQINDSRNMSGQAVELIKQLYQPEIPIRRSR